MTSIKTNSKVYIVIVNYNGWKDTVECLESLLKLDYNNFQIIVVDNSKDYDSIKKIECWATNGCVIETQFKELVTPPVIKPFRSLIILDETSFLEQTYDEKILLVKAHTNNGFSAANNIGLRYALQRNDFLYAWVLNNDTVVEHSSLSTLLTFMENPRNSKTGIAGAKIMEYTEKGTVQSAGGGTLIKPVAYSRLIGAGQIDSKQFDVDNIRMDFVAGTSMFVRKEFLKEVGLLSEDYFLYYEEPDWAERGRRFNWQMGYCYKAIIYHKGGATTGGKGYKKVKESTDISDFYFQRAKILFTRKYYWQYLPVLYLSFIIVIFYRLRRRQFSRIKFLLRILLNPNARFS